jgi:hypothetical protein
MVLITAGALQIREKHALWEILLLEEIQGYSAYGQTPFFKKFHVKRIVKLKINLIRNILNYVSIQRNYLQAVLHNLLRLSL